LIAICGSVVSGLVLWYFDFLHPEDIKVLLKAKEITYHHFITSKSNNDAIGKGWDTVLCAVC
jgi:glycerol-3-phosphate cytidylyltransferase-like family protein